MSDIKTWSQVAAENAGSAPDYAPEGHARTLVNNISRESMAAVRRQHEDPAWFDKTKGPSGLGFDVTKLSNTQINLAHQTTPTDASDKFPTGARVRVRDATTLVYGYIVSTVWASPNTVVTLVLDGASVVQATPTGIENHVTDGTIGDAAFSDIGTTLSQDPPQVPSIDDLGDGATVDQGAGNGFDADTVDGMHAADIIDSASNAGGIDLINGNFAIGQRGHALTATTTFPCDNGAYVADGWVLLMGSGTSHPAAGSGVVDVNIIASGASAGSAAPTSIQLVGNSNVGVAPVEKVGLIQWLPSDACSHLADARVSLSVWARHIPTSSFDQARIGVVCWSGTADAMAVDPISDWGAATFTPTMLAGYTLFETDSFLPSASWSEHVLEDVLIPAGTTNVAVMIWMDDTAWVDTDDVEFAGVRLARGSTAQTYINEDYAQNLLRCQRFFNSTFEEGDLVQPKGGDEATALRTLNNDGTTSMFSWEFATSMFQTPTVATYNPAAAGTLDAAPWNDTLNADSTIAATYGSKRRVTFFLSDVGDAAGNEMALHATADASL